MDLEDFTRICNMDDDGILEYFQDHRLLRRQLHCGTCNRAYSRVKEKKAVVCKYILRCPGCKTKKKITTDTMFEGARLPLRKLFGLMYFWAYSVAVTTTTAMLGVSSATVVQWFQYFR